MKRLKRNLRQLGQPPEFRIAEPAWDPELERALAAAPKPASPAPAGEASPRVDDRRFRRFLADMATGVWRLRERMLDPATKGTAMPRALEQFRREYRHVESLWDILAGAGIEVRGHDGEPFDEGLALKVIEFLPRAGIDRARVQETIKPSVFYRGRHIQLGEVFVEVPSEDGASSSAPTTPLPES